MQRSSFDTLRVRLPLRLICLFAAVGAASGLASCGGGDSAPATTPAPAPEPPLPAPSPPPPAPPPAVAGSAAECFNPALFTAGTSYQLNYRSTNLLIGGKNSVVVDGVVGAATTFEGVEGGISVTEAYPKTPPRPWPPNVSSKLTYYKLEGREVLQYGEVVNLNSIVQGQITATQWKQVFAPAKRDQRYTLMPGDEATSNFVSTSTQAPGSESTFFLQHYRGQESVTVPAGTFTVCRFDLYPGGVQTEWIIKGTGIVAKRMLLEDLEELTGASINGVVVY